MSDVYKNHEIISAYVHVQRKYNIEFDLKPEQLSLITAFVNGRNVVGFLPTGYGKSMCYVIPPLLLDEFDPSTKHTALVISPLISLMRDQVLSLKHRGIAAAYITSKQDMDPEVLKDLKHAQFSVIFASPEAAVSKSWITTFQTDEWQIQTCLFAVDESHCISEWGESFRPEYRQLSALRSIFHVPVMALTATVTSQVHADILKYLLIPEKATETTVIARIPDRPNIFLKIESTNKDHKENIGWLIQPLRAMGDKAAKTLIYCRSINITSDLYQFLCDELGEEKYINGSCIIAMYHASVEETEKVRVVEEFAKATSKIRCLIATIAFGIGVDIPDVDCVIHCGAPKSVLSYWQGVGRYARDGRDGRAIMYATPHSLHAGRTTKDMLYICKENSGCIRKAILNFLMIKEMRSMDLENYKPTLCSGSENVCRCQKSMCCSVCLDTCECIIKKKD